MTKNLTHSHSTHRPRVLPILRVPVRQRLVTLVFLTYKLYTLIGKMGGIFNSGIEYAVLCVVMMVLLGLVVRVGTDEIAPVFKDSVQAVVDGSASVKVMTRRRDVQSSEMWVILLGVVAFLGATALMVLVIIDMAQASYEIPDSLALRSFFFVWIGYPVVALISILVRQFTPSEGENGYSGEQSPFPSTLPELTSNPHVFYLFASPTSFFAEWLSFFKDILYAALDVYAKGVFALWTAFSCFSMPLAGSVPNSHPHVGPPPPSPPPVA